MQGQPAVSKERKYGNMALEEKSRAVQNSFLRGRLKETELKAEFQVLKRLRNDQQIQTHLITNDLREEQSWRDEVLDVQVARQEMQNKLAHLQKQTRELDGDKSYNVIDRTDKQAYNSKVKADMQRKRDAEQRLARAEFGPPLNIEPTNTPAAEYEEIEEF